MIRNLPKSLVESATTLYESMLLEDRIDFLKEKNPTIDMSHETNMSRQIPASALIDHLAAHADPTKNKQHTQWILGQYKKKNIRVEDAPRIKDTLTNFEKYKSKLDKKDINQYKTVGEINDALHPHIGTAATNKEASAEIHEKGRTLVHSAPDGTKVYRLEPTEHGKKASQDIYGGGSSSGGTHTDWCTAARSVHCMFDRYNKPDSMLHVIHTPDGSVYQAHVHSNQLMNSRDEDVHPTIESENGETMVDHPHAKHISNALDHIPDGYKFKVKRGFPGVTKEDISKSLASDDTDLKEIAAEHPAATAKHLDIAMKDSSGYVKRAALKNPNALQRHIDAGLNDSNQFIVASALKHKSSTPELLHAMYHNNPGDINRDIRVAAVSHKNATTALIDAGMMDKSYDVAKAAINNPNTSKQQLLSTFEHNPEKTWNNMSMEAVQHPNADHEVIDKGLDDAGIDTQYRAAAAIKNKNASHANIMKALDSVSSVVRSEAISHKNSDESHISYVLSKQDDDNASLRNHALMHPKATPAHLMIGLNDSKPTNQIQAIIHKNATPEVIHKALHNELPAVRMQAIAHRNATPENIDKALSDPDWRVAVGAAKHNNASYDNLMKALDRPEKEVKNRAVENHNSTEDHVKKAMKDSDPDVRNNAKDIGQLIMGMNV